MARLIFNGGSSSWKCGVYDVAADARAIEAGPAVAEVRVDWPHGDDRAHLETRAPDGTLATSEADVPHARAAPVILDTLARLGVDLAAMESVGHRIVHGARAFTATSWLDDAALERLRALEPFAPAHNPIEVAAVVAVGERLPEVRQYGVFDTQFHRTLEPEAYVYPGPYAWLARDIRRYGFHGSSVAYATERTAALLGRDVEALRLVVAHLGGGCSVTAVRDGRSVDTSMGFTPLDGTMMATRSGSVDPAIAVYLMREAARDGSATLASFAGDLDRTLNHESGLAGIAGTSGDLREVEAAAGSGDERARLALALFTHRLAATIGSLLPSLDRLDALVFTGGIGEHGASIRSAVVSRLHFAGLAIDPAANGGDALECEMTLPGATARTVVITSREEWYIAREGARLIA